MPMRSKPAARSFLWIAAFLTAACLGGCQTIGGLASDEYTSKVYVGVRVYADTCGQSEHGVPGWLLFLWDVPFSFSLDTILLPGTLIYEIVRSRE